MRGFFRRRLRLPALIFALLLAGCGGSTATVAHPAQLRGPIASTGCPQAAAGHGSMGACAPSSTLPKLTLPRAVAGITYPDRSNNDPTLNYAAVARAGHPAVYLKFNQGTGFIDRWAVPQVRAARAAGLAIGGYDFVSTYSAAEARLFVTLLRQAGLTRTSARTLPPVLDIEYGNATRAGVQTMVDVVRAAFGRVQVYTGNWYWSRLGCWWPRGVTAWLAGYPFAPVPCGLPHGLYVAHQYTDAGWDGVGSVDMTLWGHLTPNGHFVPSSAASFRTFAHAGPSKADLARQLRAQLAWRGHLRRVLRAHACRTVNRHRTRPVNCVLTLQRGDASNRRIRSLRAHLAGA